MPAEHRGNDRRGSTATTEAAARPHGEASRVVLVVDDDADVLFALSETLRDAGWKVLRARSVADALNRASRFHVDVILTDVLMPREDGVALQAALRREPRLRSVPIVFMTASPRHARD